MTVHNDADNSVFFRQQLEHVKKQTIDPQRPDIRFRELIPPARDPAPRGAQTILWRSYDRVGQAKIMHDYETELPMVNVFGKQMSSPVHQIGIGYDWTEQELDHARMAGVPLQAWKREDAMVAAERKLQDICFFGDATLNLPGMFRNSNVATITAATDGPDTTWTQKLAAGKWQAVLADIASVINSVPENTFGRERGNTFLLPMADYHQLAQFHVGVDVNRSLLTMAKEAHPGVEFDWLNELDTAAEGGGKLAVFYDRSNRVLGREIPKEPTEMPAQSNVFRHIVPVHGTCGGCAILYPAAVKYFEGF